LRSDCNDAGRVAVPQLEGGTGIIDPMFFTSLDAQGRTVNGGEEAVYGTATFVKSEGPLKLCYKFNKEPFMEYYTFPVTVTGISEVRGIQGDNDMIVLDMVKQLGFVGNGVGEGDMVTWVVESASSDSHCLLDSIYNGERAKRASLEENEHTSHY